MGSGALVAIGPMVAGLDQGGAAVSLRTAVAILVASIIYASLMLLVIKVAANLTRGWRIGKAPGFMPSFGSNGFSATHHERPLLAQGGSGVQAATVVSSDRVRSTVASIETAALSHRMATPATPRLAMPAPVSPLSLQGPSDARGQLRYLHHRVSGVPTNVSREMLR
jgi:hypothetical protein